LTGKSSLWGGGLEIAQHFCYMFENVILGARNHAQIFFNQEEDA
jgi:hypothetical protein